MNGSAPLTLRTAIDRTSYTEALFDGTVQSERLQFDFVTVKPVTRAFRRMARLLEFDMSEMALATHAIAHRFGKPFRALPAVLLRELPQPALVCLRDSEVDHAQKLAGRRIAVRSYSQTTAVWVRGILEMEYGVDPRSITWVTQEDSHVAEYPAQANESPCDPALSIYELLQSGMADAAVTLHLGSHPNVRSVIPDAEREAAAWQVRHGIRPINHMPVIKTALLDAHPWLAAELLRLFEAARRLAAGAGGADPLPWDQAGAAMLLRFSASQGLTPRLYAPDELLVSPDTQFQPA